MFFDNGSGLGGAGYGNTYNNPFDINYNWGTVGAASSATRCAPTAS